MDSKSLIVHDWEDRAYYESLKKEKNLSRWGWEFLRRNPDYQKDYDQFSQFPDSSPFVGVKNGKWKGTPALDDRFYVTCFYYTDPPGNYSETVEWYLRRCSHGKIVPYAVHLCEKYHLQWGSIHDPRIDYERLPRSFGFQDNDDNHPFGSHTPPWEIIEISPPFPSDIFKIDQICELESWQKSYFENWLERLHRYTENPDIVFFAFDLNKSIGSQLDFAEQSLLLEKDNRQKTEKALPKRINKYRDYVRILDMLSAGIDDINRIGMTIYPNEEDDENNRLANKVKKNIKAAKTLRDANYWQQR